MKKRIIIGISGASGACYGVRMTEALMENGHEVHLIITSYGQKVLKHETGLDMNGLEKRLISSGPGTLTIHDNGDLFAPPASGSFQHNGMAVMPCSMKTLSSLAAGNASCLLDRAGDVTIKERRPLVIVPRETPVSLIHLRNMCTLSEAGAVIMPASPGFYHRPGRIEDLVDFMVARVLDQLGITHSLTPRWGEQT